MRRSTYARVLRQSSVLSQTILTIVAGFALLAAGGELLVRGSAQLAARFGVSALVIGLTVVSFGTSAPELFVSLQSVYADAADLAVGNVVGSNIFNVLFILGASALVTPLVVSRRVIWVEVPIVILVSVVAWGLAADGRVTWPEGLLLLAVIAAYLIWVFRTSKEHLPESTTSAPSRSSPLIIASVMTLAGIGVLVIGARWLVDGSVALASAFGVSDAVIGLTVVAAGTSLPEVAATLVAALRGQREMAVGNVLGSNVFNLTVILGTTAVAAGELPVPEGLLKFDMIVMLAVAFACLPMFVTGHRIDRWEGALFLAYYAAYVTYLVLDATAHHQLTDSRDALNYFALPLTAVTLVVLAGRRVWRRSRR